MKFKTWKISRAKQELDPNQTDSDYLRVNGSCTGCGEHIGHLPGYSYIEDCDECPDCRKGQKGVESWRQELTRILNREVKNGMPKEDKKEILDELKQFGL